MIKVHCPICDRTMHGASTAEWPEFPFCSPKCKLIDLGRWLGEDYRVASKETDESDDPPTEDEDEDEV
ncbi:hypothetical protein BH10PLA2_BH10PLA2_25060 [soil metagenome]